MAFMHSNKYRHVVLISSDKKFQQLTEAQKLLCTDYEGLENLFGELAARKKKAEELALTKVVFHPGLNAPAVSQQRQITNR